MHKVRNFHEGRSTVGEWQGRGRVTAWKRHGMCESAFRVISSLFMDVTHRMLALIYRRFGRACLSHLPESSSC
jgi:hypothetical protein